MSKAQDKKEGAKVDAKKVEEAMEPTEGELDAALEASGDALAGEKKPAEDKPEKPAEEKAGKHSEVGEWSKDPKAVIKRVFRVAQFKKGVPYNHNIATLLKEAVVVGNQKVGAKSATISPNHALQYVLIKGAIDYADQLEALRVMEEKGVIKEVNPECEGAVWLPEKVLAARKAEAEYKKKMAELEAM